MTADRLIAAFHKARSARITFGWSPEADKTLNELWEALAAYEGQQGAQAPAEAHGTEPLPHVIEERDAYASELARCRDAFPIPEPGTALDEPWQMAMGDPLCVADYVTAALANVQPKGTDEIADAARVIAWARDPERKPANSAFTDGPERQAAYWIEWAQSQAPAPAHTTPEHITDAQVDALFDPDAIDDASAFLGSTRVVNLSNVRLVVRGLLAGRPSPAVEDAALLRMVLDDMATCVGEMGSDYEFKELSTETVEALADYRERNK